MTLVEAEKVALTILKQVMEEKLAAQNVEVVTVTPTTDAEGRITGVFKRLTEAELDTLVEAI